MRKALSVLVDILFLLVGLLGIALIILRLVGVQFFAVQTGSMGEAYPVGSIVVVYNCDPEQIEVGDVITYLLNGQTETYVTHRVNSIDTDEQYFVTQGDANNTPDKSTVSFSSCLGKVIYCIPKLGYPLLRLGTAVKWLIVGIIGALALLCFALGFRKKSPTQEETDAQQKT